MPATGKKLACCSARSAKLKKANFDKAKSKADAATKASVGKHVHMNPKKAPAKKHPPSKPAKACKVCAKK